MKVVLFPGIKLERYKCGVCGQVELHSAEEVHTCQNCGHLMEKVIQEKTEDPGKVEQEKTPEQTSKKKIGRPRKNQPFEKAGTCSMCKNALRNETGYTCEIDWQSHVGSDTCPNHKDGVPVD